MFSFKVALTIGTEKLNTSGDLALWLSKNYRKGLVLLENGTIASFLQKDRPEFWEKIEKYTKDYKYKENQLTFIINMLEPRMGFITKTHEFKSIADISFCMKQNYPQVEPEVKILFSDKVLPDIMWDYYEKTQDQGYKRNYTFLTHITENAQYDFTYFYFLYLNLDKQETVRFMLDGASMTSMAQIADYIGLHQEQATYLVEEILNNRFILAFIASKIGIDVLSGVLQSNNSLELLKPLSKYTNYDYTPIISSRMSFWLLSHYQNYVYETEEALKLKEEYDSISGNLTLSSIADYIEANDIAEKLYKKFVSLYSFNRIVTYKKGITAVGEYYLGYQFDDEYACLLYLKETNRYDETIFTDEYSINVERKVLIDLLENEKALITKYSSDVQEITKDVIYPKKTLKHKKFIASMLIILLMVSFVLAFFTGFYTTLDITSYVLFALAGLSLVFLLATLASISHQLKNLTIIQEAVHGANNSILAIDEEISHVKDSDNYKEYETLSNLEVYHKNREANISRMQKFSGKKVHTGSFPLIVGAFLGFLPFAELLQNFLLTLMGKTPWNPLPTTYAYLDLVYAFLYLVLMIVFRKKSFAYYFIFILVAIMILFGILL